MEDFTGAALLIGRRFKYGDVGNELGVKIFGLLRGGVFLFYLVATALFALRLRLRWPWSAALLALIAAVPPLVTVPLEMWFRRMDYSAPASDIRITAGRGPPYVG